MARILHRHRGTGDGLVAGLAATTSARTFEPALARMGYDSFRPGQLEALETLFHKGRLVLVAPTGGGKSLIYQLPATLLDGTTLVISPLIALMQDQVEALAPRGVSATYLASTLPRSEEHTSELQSLAYLVCRLLLE